MISIILYGVLGIALNWAGVSILQKPVEFLVILAIVVGISLANKFE